MKKTKIYLLFVIIGIILASIVGPIFGVSLSQLTIDKGRKLIKETSMIGFAESYSKQFRLDTDQTCHIEFSNYYANISADIMILTKNQYDYYYNVNGSNPFAGEQFILLERQTGSFPIIHYLTSYEIAWDGSTYGNNVDIEFRGDGRTSIPGVYYVVVRGTNDFVENDEVQFYIKISIDGPGKAIQEVLILIGILMVIIVSLIWIYNSIKGKKGER